MVTCHDGHVVRLSMEENNLTIWRAAANMMKLQLHIAGKQ